MRSLLEIHGTRVGLLAGTSWLITRRVGFDDMWTFVLLAAALEILRNAGDFRQHAPWDVAAHIIALSCCRLLFQDHIHAHSINSIHIPLILTVIDIRESVLSKTQYL
jgi:hypothetical protein